MILVAVIEGGAKLWWFQIESCAFEDSDVYEGLNPEMKRQMCIDSYQLQISDERIEPLQESDTMNINSYGFRGKEISIIKPDNTYRIFTVGGSTMLGTGSTSDVTTISGFLQEFFDSISFPFDIEVVNAGISGAWSNTETSLIKTKLLDFDPDMLIIYDGWNDSTDIAGWSPNNENSQEISMKWVQRWNEICDIGNNNFKTIIILQPILGTSERDLSKGEFAIYSEIKDGNVLQRLNILGSKLDSFNKSCDLVLDFRKAFDGVNQPIFWDPGHVSNTGNQIIAKKMFESALPLISDIKPNQSDLSLSSQNDEVSSNASKDSFVQIKRFVLKHYKTPLLINNLLNFNQEQLVTQSFQAKGSVKTFDDIDFSKNLRNSNFQNFYMPNSDFSKMELGNSDFSNSYVKNSNFQNSNLQNSKFVNVNMRGANLSETQLNSSDFTNSDLTGANISHSDLENTKFLNSYLYNVNLRNSNLSSIDFKFTNILGVDFQGANLYQADFTGQDLRRSFFMNANLTNTNFMGAYLDISNMKNAVFQSANLSNAVFIKNNFESLDLTNVNFSETELFNSNFQNSILSGTDFSGTNLQNADFSNSNLEDAIGDPFIGCKNHHLCQ